MRYSLITITHTGAYSIVKAARDAGWNVVAPQGVAVHEKVRALREAQDADLLWAHWSWIGMLPGWVLEDREVITVLRDPIECALSAFVRGKGDKAPQHARQWLNLWTHREHVNQWVDFRKLSLDSIGLGPLPRENTTPREHPLKLRYQQYGQRGIWKRIGTMWDCLRVVRPEIWSVFDGAEMGEVLKGTMFHPDSVKADIRNGVA